MNKNSISEKLNLIFAYLRLKRIKLRVPNLRFERWTNISPKTELDIANDSTVSFGRGLHTRPYSAIAVRENAELTIGKNVFINRNTIIACRKSINIGNDVTIGPNCCIYDHDHNVSDLNGGGYVSDDVIIKDKAWLGANVIVLKGVMIGEGSVIAAGSIVAKDVPDHTILIQKRISNYKLLSNIDENNKDESL